MGLFPEDRVGIEHHPALGLAVVRDAFGHRARMLR
jgi:hypothetical protein